MIRRVPTVTVVVVAAACSVTPTGEPDWGSTSSTGEETAASHASVSATAADTGGGSESGGGGGVKYDVAAADTGSLDECAGMKPPTDAVLEGRVWAPNGYIPVSGALVWLSTTPPEGIPDHVYCEECVELPCEVPNVRTEADGTFSLEVPSGQDLYLAVQKGQFLRITPIDVEPGSATMLPEEITTLPDHRAPEEGLYIPNIALNFGVFDRLEHTLGKLGLADTVVDPAAISEKYVPGTEQWDTWENGLTCDTTRLGTFEDLVRDYSKLEKYHIVFVPCSMDVFESAFVEPEVLDNVRKWVAAGGKWYVADWSNEFVEHPFGQYQEFFHDENDTDLDEYDSIGTVLDPAMLAWLEALPDELQDINPLNFPKGPFPTITDLPHIDLVDNWSGVDQIPPVWSEDEEGDPVDVGHKTWIEGPGYVDVPPGIHPMAITAEYGCGRLMFTTFHTSKGGSYIGVTPQEMVLLYLILEIGVCQTPYDIPPEG